MGYAEDREDGENENSNDIEKRKPRDAKRDYAAEEGDGVSWDELGECDQEGDLKRSGTTDWRKSG